MRNKLLIVLWGIGILLLFLYSFVQVDLGLTLTRASFFQSIQQSFQYIGYFNRPLSAYLFSGIVIGLSALYIYTLYVAFKKKITVKFAVLLIGIVSVVLLFSYNATSYDLFNYIFDAKIVTHYNENPYVKKALDYPSDPMLGFMHWTHRTYPYGPVWLGLTIPLSFIGSGYFLLTFYLIKLLVVGSYVLTCFLLYKILKVSKVANPLLGLIFFALNPLVLIETLLSAHNDIPMMALALLGVYFLIEKKKYSAWVSLLFSIGVKFGTAALLPVFLWYPFSKRQNKNTILFAVSFLCMLVTVLAASYRTTFQPWYFLFCLPFAALLYRKLYISIPVIIFSVLILFQYVPFFYTGNFDPPIPNIMNQMLSISIGVAVISGIVVYLRTKK